MASRKFFNSSRHSQDLSAVLGETLSPGDSHHIKNNTMDFKCLLRSIDGGKKVLGLGTIFQIAAELGKVFPSQINRSIPLASGHLLLEAVSLQALCNIINSLLSWLPVQSHPATLTSQGRGGAGRNSWRGGPGMPRWPADYISGPLVSDSVAGASGGYPHLGIQDWWGYQLLPRPGCPGMWGWGTPPVFWECPQNLLTPLSATSVRDTGITLIIARPLTLVQDVPETITLSCAAVGTSFVQTAALSIQPPTGGAMPFHSTEKKPQHRPRTAYPGRRLKSLLGPETGHQSITPFVALPQGPLPLMDLGACAWAQVQPRGVPIQKTPSPVRSSVLPGPGGISSPKSGGGDFRSSSPHNGEAVESVAEAVGSSSLTTMSLTGTP